MEAEAGTVSEPAGKAPAPRAKENRHYRPAPSPRDLKALPGGFAIGFANGGQHIYVYGREPHVSQAAGSLTIEQAKSLAKRSRGR